MLPPEYVTRRLLGDPPRRILSVGAGVVEAHGVPVRVAKVRLAPQPGHIPWRLVEGESFVDEPDKFGVELLGLEVHGHRLIRRDMADEFDRKGGVAVRALKAQVVVVTDDQSQSKSRVETFGSGEIDGTDGDLVESHAY